MLTRQFSQDPLAMLRRMTSEFDRLFESTTFPTAKFSLFRTKPQFEVDFLPQVDVFERNNLLVTKVDLPGLKKEDVKVEVVDGYLTISGHRKAEAEEKKGQYYRCEREYGSFYRAIPLPEAVKFDDVKANFVDGVLEVTVPIPVKTESKRSVKIVEPQKELAGV